jgi:uncharacterized protein (DUF433 family)
MLEKSKKPVRHYDEGDYVVGSFASENNPVGFSSDVYSTNPELVAAPFPGADTDPNTNPNVVGDANSPFKRGDVFVNQTPISSLSVLPGLSDLSRFITSNKGLIAGGAALMGATGNNNAQYGKSGYQGAIPNLMATRNMISAPPTREMGYRPGAGGIDYGGDVTYSRMPAGMDAWANLSGNSGTLAGTNLAGIKGATVIPGGNKTSTIVGGKGNDTIVGGGGNDTIVGGTGNDTINLGSKGYQAAIAAGLTPAQYLNNINQWLIDNPRASKAQIDAAMGQFGVSQEDLQEALRTTTFSDYTKYGLTHGMGLQELNFAISDWVAKNPYATNDQIQKAMEKAGVNDEDIARGLNALSASAGKEYAIINDMGLDQLYKNILDYQAAGHSPAEVAAVMAQYGIEQRDVNNANKYAAETGYKADPTSYAGVGDYSDLGGGSSDAGSSAVNDTAVSSGGGGLDTSNEIYQYFADPGVQAALASGDVGGILETMQDSGWSPAEVAAATGTSEADVQAAYDAAIGNYAQGGMAKGRYLKGETDGMADKLPARIGRDQPAALSHGEFVIPADVVSHMGNGNSEAGAKKLYQMMDKIRMARTGNKKQGKKINPDKFMPGGLAQAYAAGGEVKKFQTGGTTGAPSPAAGFNAGLAGVESNLSNWAGPYVTNMLGQGQALANMPYQAYMGPLTAGESPLQTSAFTNAAALQTPSSIGTAATEAGKIGTAAQGLQYTPTTTSFDATQAQNYMNPYLQASLNPQLEEARRQSQITQQQNAAKMTQAGAFGGSRQAILDAETQRNLGSNLANITGTGYNTAFNNAQQQFNADQQRKMQEAQYGAGFGLQGLQTGLQAAQAQGALGTQQNQAGINTLNAQLGAGAQQRGIESEGIAADKAQFEEARANPYKMVQFQQSLLQGLPTASQSYNATQPSALQSAAQATTTVNQLLKNLGL